MDFPQPPYPVRLRRSMPLGRGAKAMSESGRPSPATGAGTGSGTKRKLSFGERLAEAAAFHQGQDEQKAARAESDAARAEAKRAWEAKLDAEAAEFETIKAEVEALWPESLFPRTPRAAQLEMYDGLGGPDDISPNFLEDPWRWKRLLTLYPALPATETARQAGEAVFWRDQVAMHLNKSDPDKPDLDNRQKIFDYYRVYEKWILREYRVATGIARETFLSRDFYFYLCWKKQKISSWDVDEIAAYLKERGKPVPLWCRLGRFATLFENVRHEVNGFNQARKEDLEAANRKNEAMQESYFKERHKAHFETACEWYFFHVEQAFQAMQQHASRTFSRPSEEL